MSSATSIGVRNWPRSARAPSSSAASPASRRPAASESRSTALGYRVCPAASGGRGPTVTRGSRAWCGVWGPWASPALPGPRGHCRLNEDSTRPGRLPWPGAPAGACGLLRASALGFPVARGTGSFTPLLARHQPSGSPWPGWSRTCSTSRGAPPTLRLPVAGGTGLLMPRGVDLPVAREYCCGACGPAAGRLRSLGTLVPPGRGSGASGVFPRTPGAGWPGPVRLLRQ